MAIPNALPRTGYPPACTDTSWKAAKTDGKRDKWNTELGAALRAAKTAYDLIDLERLDLALYRQNHGQKLTLQQMSQLKAGAQQHVTQVVKPAIKALEKAKSKAAAAAINPVLSAQTRTRANAIKNLLGLHATQLKLVDFDDYDRTIATYKANLDRMYKDFDDDLSAALRRAVAFVKVVKATPTPANFNHGIETAARDITQQLGNVPTLQANGYRLLQTNAQHLVDQLEDWAQGRGDLDDNASRAQVKQAITAFEKVLFEVAKWRT
jgi:hypothetical protein